MSKVIEEATAGNDGGAVALPSLLRRLRRGAPVVGWVFGLGVAMPAYQRGDLLEAALRGGAVWALAVVVWTVGLTVCERLLATEAGEASPEAPGAADQGRGGDSASPTGK